MSKCLSRGDLASLTTRSHTNHPPHLLLSLSHPRHHPLKQQLNSQTHPEAPAPPKRSAFGRTRGSWESRAATY